MYPSIHASAGTECQIQLRHWPLECRSEAYHSRSQCGTVCIVGLEVLKQLERRAEAYSGGGSARAAPLVRVENWRVVELAAGSTDAH